MTIADLINDFVKTSKDRLKSPLTGSFIIAFIFWNWRFISILFFSKIPVINRIKEIDKNYYNYFDLFIPLSIALVYVIGIPYLTMYIDKINASAIEKREEIKSRIKLSKLIGIKDVLEQEHNNNKIRSGNKEQEELLQQIETLKLQIDLLNEQHDDVKDGYEKIITEKENSYERLNTLYQNKSMIYESDKDELKRILSFTGIKDIDERLSITETSNFNIFYKKHVLGSNLAAVIPEADINRYIDLKLAKRKSPYEMERTHLGDLYYEYLQKN